MKHKWKSQQVGGDPTDAASTEWVTYCDVCGVESDGDDYDEECEATYEQS